MKKLLIVALATSAFAATPALADPAEILITANVAKACGVGHHISGADAAPGWDQSDIVVDLNNAGNGQFSGQTFNNRSFGNVWCNGPANVTLEVGALRNTDALVTDTGSFTNRFDVRVTTDAGVYVGQGTNFTLTTVGQAGGVATQSGTTAGAFETGLQRFGGANSIEVLPAARGDGEGPLRAYAGDYSGYVRFTATAQ